MNYEQLKRSLKAECDEGWISKGAYLERLREIDQEQDRKISVMKKGTQAGRASKRIHFDETVIIVYVLIIFSFVSLSLGIVDLNTIIATILLGCTITGIGFFIGAIYPLEAWERSENAKVDIYPKIVGWTDTYPIKPKINEDYIRSVLGRRDCMWTKSRFDEDREVAWLYPPVIAYSKEFHDFAYNIEKGSLQGKIRDSISGHIFSMMIKLNRKNVDIFKQRRKEYARRRSRIKGPAELVRRYYHLDFKYVERLFYPPLSEEELEAAYVTTDDTSLVPLDDRKRLRGEFKCRHCGKPMIIFDIPGLICGGTVRFVACKICGYARRYYSGGSSSALRTRRIGIGERRNWKEVVAECLGRVHSSLKYRDIGDKEKLSQFLYRIDNVVTDYICEVEKGNQEEMNRLKREWQTLIQNVGQLDRYVMGELKKLSPIFD